MRSFSVFAALTVLCFGYAWAKLHHAHDVINGLTNQTETYTNFTIRAVSKVLDLGEHAHPKDIMNKLMNSNLANLDNEDVQTLRHLSSVIEENLERNETFTRLLHKSHHYSETFKHLESLFKHQKAKKWANEMHKLFNKPNWEIIALIEDHVFKMAKHGMSQIVLPEFCQEIAENAAGQHDCPEDKVLIPLDVSNNTFVFASNSEDLNKHLNLKSHDASHVAKLENWLVSHLN